ncbi:MAG TPA: cupin domain-containing protein [Deltaproteobacteria bacterium]|nr:cupin domain-containing protein [Deltaproteobacteria bacterium]
MKCADYWIERLRLEKHPEGGFFRETYRSSKKIDQCYPASRLKGSRPAATAVYFLLPGDKFSALHRLRSDEIWHHYDGTSLTIHMIDARGGYEKIFLGTDPDKDEEPQAVVPAGIWFGATVNDRDSYVLVGCTVSPGFIFQDFEMARQDELLRVYPEHKEIIEMLTYNSVPVP